MKVWVYIATSLDGFIARPDGSLDWLEGSSDEPVSGAGESNGAAAMEDHGWEDFFGPIDTVVMGRGTFDFVSSSGQWIYDNKRTIVLSSRPGTSDIASHLAGKVEVMSIEPTDLLAKLDSEGSEHVYIDGGVTIQRFLRAALVDELILTRAPLLLGSGISLFGELDDDVQLRHIETHVFASGMVQSRYSVSPSKR